ncbi:hypothetical protein SAMN05444389_101421 [Paracoccus solventivorans]|uniref:Uncharacterized protein n=1 Tax=Paracoccus solventivorans TaxID=53463 RepID=A0A1M7DL25_9RHOB|nr:hypothetical protein [Paracoccus solventivorans]SHL80165.1 hypothetical protein SAMN05444389_101421 [Paracoccus solventivorans]
MTPLPTTLRDRGIPARAQTSRINDFAPQGGRGRSRSSARRAHVWAADPGRRRDEFTQRWSRLIMVSFASPEACALWADQTTQTARNWIEGCNRPYGDVVTQAWLTLPDFARIMGEE